MEVEIEAGPDNGFGTQHRLRILTGYRAGEFVRNAASEEPLFDVDPVGLRNWAEQTGYVVKDRNSIEGGVMSSAERVTVNGHPAVKMELTVRKGAFSVARSAIGKSPSSDEFAWLLGILDGQTVAATVFSGTNVVGHTNEDQLRQAFARMNPGYAFWIKEPQLEVVIKKFGDGKIGFDMSGRYCEQTPAEIERLLSSVQEANGAPQKFEYQLLGRLQQDCDYYLGAGGRSKKHLWALDEAAQIEKMKELYEILAVKPEWITLEDIKGYEEKMVIGQQDSTRPRG